MKKFLLRFAVAALALCLGVPGARAVDTDQNGHVIIRVGLASSSSHVETGELEAANLENNTASAIMTAGGTLWSWPVRTPP